MKRGRDGSASILRRRRRNARGRERQVVVVLERLRDQRVQRRVAEQRPPAVDGQLRRETRRAAGAQRRQGTERRFGRRGAGRAGAAGERERCKANAQSHHRPL
jgi:hypothetical protein